MKTRIITATLLMFTVMSFAQRKEIRKAGNAVEDGEYAEAKNYLQQAEPLLSDARDKDVAKFYLTKGQAFLGDAQNVSVEDLMTAAEAYKKAQELGEEEAEEGIRLVSAALVDSAIADQESQDYASAADKLYKSYELNKKDTNYLYFAGVYAYSAEDFDRALEYFQELKDLGYTGIQTQYLATNKETGEVEAMGKDQRDLLVKTGQYTDPKEQVTESRKGEIAKYVALLHIENGDNEKAIEAMEAAKAENPDDTSLLFSEAQMYLEMGDTEKYTEIMEEIVERDPNNPTLFYNLGVTSAELGKNEKAMEYYKRAIELDPEMVNAYNNLALMTIDTREPLVEEMNNLGMSEEDNKRYEELEKEIFNIYEDALVYLEKVLELDPTRIETARTMMNLYSILGETEKAEEMKQKIQSAPAQGATQGQQGTQGQQ